MADGPPRPTADLLRVVQWLSPAFPVGGYAYSHGLETAIAAGDVDGPATFEAWLSAVVLAGGGWCDAVLLSCAHRDVAPPGDLHDLALALAPGRERAAETLALGTAFGRAADALTGTPGPAFALPVAVGWRAQALDVATPTLAALYLQAFAGNLATIAARAVPLGQSAAQAALAALGPAITARAADAATATPDDLTSAVPAADLASLAHETAEARLFTT